MLTCLCARTSLTPADGDRRGLPSPRVHQQAHKINLGMALVALARDAWPVHVVMFVKFS